MRWLVRSVLADLLPAVHALLTQTKDLLRVSWNEVKRHSDGRELQDAKGPTGPLPPVPSISFDG